MKDLLTYTSAASAGSALIFTIQDLYSIVGLVCTCISVFVLLVNLFIKLYDRIKDKHITKQEVADTLDDFEEFAENLKNLKK